MSQIRQGTVRSAVALLAWCGLAVPALAQQTDQPEETPKEQDRPRLTTPRPGSRGPTLRSLQERGVPRVQMSPDGMQVVQPGVEDGEVTGEEEPEDREPLQLPPDDSEVIEFSAFSEGIQLRDLVEFVAETLDIPVAIDPALEGTVTFNSGFVVSRDELLPLLNSLLEQQGFAISQDPNGWFIVRRAEGVTLNPLGTGALATTRLIRTPNIKPSSLKDAVDAQFGVRGGVGPGGAGGASSLRIAYIDDLGVIVMTDTPQRVRAVAMLVEAIVAEQASLTWVRMELKHVAAPVARDRAIELVGGTVSSGTQFPGARAQRPPNDPNQQPGAPGATTGLENFASRLRVDPQGNALIFRGREDEIALVRQALEVIDQPSRLTPKRYFAGSSARDIANLAHQQGLGEVTYFDSSGGTMQQQPGIPQQPNQQGFQFGVTELQGGPVLVVDEYRGYILYSGTDEQQVHFTRLIEQFKPEDEAIIIRNYPLEHGDAQEVSDLLNAVLLGEEPVASGGLLPENQGGRGGRNQNQQNQQSRQNQQNRQQNRTSVAGGDRRFPRSFGIVDEENPEEAGFSGDPTMIQITPDLANNQVIVRAPMQQQREIEKILERIDIRRPQVYIDVKIVTLSNTDEFRLAVETQLINAGGEGGALQTNWGITSGGTSFIDPRVVATGLPGFTGAIIRSDYIPFAITAIQEVTDAKIVSNPTLLVDDNEDAEIVSTRLEPTVNTTQNNATTERSFGGYEEAGTRLTVTPRISEGGYLRLNYDIELSNFVGASTEDGIPPAKDVRNVYANSVTVPGDATIVVGGIKIDDVRRTVAKIPFLGDIPLLGHAFRDTRTNNDEAILYVFITPRILADEHFGGHRLITEGPRRISELAPDMPALETIMVPIVAPPAGLKAVEMEGE